MVSEQWVEKILTPHVNYVYLGSMQVQYGYLWYIFPKGTLNKQYTVYGCCGAGGQHLFIIPECNLVFVVVSNNYEYHMQGLEYAAEILNNYVITAFNENKNEK